MSGDDPTTARRAPTAAWRHAHIFAGDDALRTAERIASGAGTLSGILWNNRGENQAHAAAAYAAIAQAHYAAASVRVHDVEPPSPGVGMPPSHWPGFPASINLGPMPDPTAGS